MYGTENYIPDPMTNHKEKRILKKKECVYMYNRITLPYIRNKDNIVN